MYPRQEPAGSRRGFKGVGPQDPYQVFDVSTPGAGR